MEGGISEGYGLKRRKLCRVDVKISIEEQEDTSEKTPRINVKGTKRRRGVHLGRGGGTPTAQKKGPREEAPNNLT